MLGGWKFANVKDGRFAEYFHVNDASANLAHIPDGLSDDLAIYATDMMSTGFMSAKTIRTGLCPGGNVRMKRLLRLLETDRVDPTPLTTHRMPFDEVDRGLRMMETKQNGILKPLIEF